MWKPEFKSQRGYTQVHFIIPSCVVVLYRLCQLSTQVVPGCLNCLRIDCYITLHNLHIHNGRDQYTHCGLHLQSFLSMNVGFVFAIFFYNLFMLQFLSISVSLLSLFLVCNPYKLLYKSLQKSSTRCGGKQFVFVLMKLSPSLTKISHKKCNNNKSTPFTLKQLSYFGETPVLADISFLAGLLCHCGWDTAQSLHLSTLIYKHETEIQS